MFSLPQLATSDGSFGHPAPWRWIIMDLPMALVGPCVVFGCRAQKAP